jgi:SAM-dependent methyltransferase
VRLPRYVTEETITMQQVTPAPSVDFAHPTDAPTQADLRRRSDDPKLTHYPEARFGGFSDVDQVVIFYTRVRALLGTQSIVLDVGCGRGKAAGDPTPMRRRLKDLRDASAQVIGIDVDPEGESNPMVSEFRPITANGRWPVADASIDLVLADYVLEHVDDPDSFFAECRRVCKAGGYVCIRTTNARSYFALASRLTPNASHAGIIQRVYRNPRPADDVFPTLYRCNTVGKLRSALTANGFDACVYGFQSDPAHFGFSRPLYALGVAHQRFAPKGLKPALFAFARLR